MDETPTQAENPQDVGEQSQPSQPEQPVRRAGRTLGSAPPRSTSGTGATPSVTNAHNPNGIGFGGIGRRR